MAFPTTAVLDNFNRANGALGASWTSGFYGDGTTLGVNSNQLANSATAWAGSYYNVASYGPDCEIYFDIPTKDTGGSASFVLWLRAGGTLTGNPTGYYMTCDGGVWSIRRADGTGSDTQLGSTFFQTITNGDSLGFSAVGSTLTAYYKAGAGSWTTLTTRTDSTYSAAGKLVIEIQSNIVRLDNFGGGTIGGGGGTVYTASANWQGMGRSQAQASKLAKALTNLPSQGAEVFTPVRATRAQTTLPAAGQGKATPVRKVQTALAAQTQGMESGTPVRASQTSARWAGSGQGGTLTPVARRLGFAQWQSTAQAGVPPLKKVGVLANWTGAVQQSAIAKKLAQAAGAWQGEGRFSGQPSTGSVVQVVAYAYWSAVGAIKDTATAIRQGRSAVTGQGESSATPVRKVGAAARLDTSSAAGTIASAKKQATGAWAVGGNVATFTGFKKAAAAATFIGRAILKAIGASGQLQKNRPQVIIAEVPRPIATIEAGPPVPVVVISQVATPLAVLVESVIPQTKIVENMARPSAVIEEVEP
jgi:hypothetical protein